MRVLTVLVAILVLAPAGSAGAVELRVVPPALDPVLRADPDGGFTLVALLEDGVGGSYRHVPLSDAGLAASSSAPADNDVFLDPVIYQANLKEVGMFAHSFEIEGTPFLTLGAYAVTTDTGIVRVPVVMLENVADLDGAAMLLAELATDEAYPLLAEAIPHAWGLAAPDAFALAADIAILAGPFVGFTAGLGPALQGSDGATTLANLPPEIYPAIGRVGADAALLVAPLYFGPQGLPAERGDAAPYAEDWTDRPEVRAWTVRKTSPAGDVWQGTYLARTGSAEGESVETFRGTKRVEAGVIARANGATTHVAGLYVQTDVARAADATSVASSVRYSVGATAADAADVPLAAVEMEGASADSGGDFFLPQEGQEDLRAGVYADGAFTPLVGARTTVTHDVHDDVTNLGDFIVETETERVTSVGAYVLGEYVPVVGARYWGERHHMETLADAIVVGGLLGSQTAGDAEVSAGAFAQGEYLPAIAARLDDDFLYHLYDHRTMVSAGTYVDGVYQPVAGTTYDGERTLLDWAAGHTSDTSQGDRMWQTSVGSFTFGFYRPVFGTRFEPGTHFHERAQQESYQVGVYPLHYDPFIRVAAVEYDGDEGSGMWGLSLVGASLGGTREGEFDVDAVAFTPGPFAFPLAGVQYRTWAPDQSAEFDSHVVIGAYQGETFTPILGATVSMDDVPVGFALAQAQGVQSDARVSIGHYANGEYEPIATVDTALVPTLPPILP